MSFTTRVEYLLFTGALSNAGSIEAISDRPLTDSTRFPTEVFVMNAEENYSKWIRDAEGLATKRYTAIDPAEISIVCTCGRAECHRARLLPFREHIAELYRVILKLHEDEVGWLLRPSSSESVLYALRMAASIEDVEADTGYVEDPMMFALCEPAIDYERGQSEMASKYVAAASIFNFIWQAYEAAVSQTASGELNRLMKEKRFGERGRRILEARPEMTAQFRGIGDLVKLALLQCRRGGLMDNRCDAVEAKYGTNSLVAAAELAREFRNFLFHGGDEAPAHEHWGDTITSRCRIYRFYSVSVLALYAIQAMCWIEHEDEEELVEYGSDEDELTPRQIFERLQFKGPGIWPPLSQSQEVVTAPA